MLPGQFGESFNAEAAIAEMEPSFQQTESGLYIPNSLAEQRRQEGQVQVDATQPEAAEDVTQAIEGQEAGTPTTAPEANVNVGDTVEEMDKIIEEGAEELDALGVTQAKTEEEAAEMMAQMAAEQGADVDESKKRAHQLLDKMAAIAGMTFNEFQAANQGSDLKTFLDIFFVGAEGRFGGASTSSLRESLGQNNDDAYLNEELSRGSTSTLTEFFREVLGQPNLQNLDEIKDLINQFNNKAELDWGGLEAKMTTFLNEAKGQYVEKRSFLKMKAVFSRLGGMNSEKILEYFNISTATEGEVVAAEGGATEANAQNPNEAATSEQVQTPVENPAEQAA